MGIGRFTSILECSMLSTGYQSRTTTLHRGGGHKASSVGAALSNFSKSFSSKRTKWSFLFTGVGGMASATYTLGAEINGSRLHTYLA